MVNNQSKKIISSLILMLMMFSITLPVLANDPPPPPKTEKLGDNDYWGTDGNYYEVTHFRDTVTGAEWTEFYVTGPDGKRSDKRHLNGLKNPFYYLGIENPDDDGDGNDPTNPLDDMLPDGNSDETYLQSNVNMPSPGIINYSVVSKPEGSNGNITVEVIDPATNQTVQSLSVASEAKIDASGLVPHQPYAIVSTTAEGAIEVKTIKVSETELFINTDDK